MIKNKNGFSFLEILISVFLVSLIIVPFFSYFIIVTRENYDLRVKNNAVMLASDILESYFYESDNSIKTYDRDIYSIKENVISEDNYDRVIVEVEYRTISGRSSVKLSKYYEK